MLYPFQSFLTFKIGGREGGGQGYVSPHLRILKSNLCKHFNTIQTKVINTKRKKMKPSDFIVYCLYFSMY